MASTQSERPWRSRRSPSARTDDAARDRRERQEGEDLGRRLTPPRPHVLLDHEASPDSRTPGSPPWRSARTDGAGDGERGQDGPHVGPRTIASADADGAAQLRRRGDRARLQPRRTVGSRSAVKDATCVPASTCGIRRPRHAARRATTTRSPVSRSTPDGHAAGDREPGRHGPALGPRRPERGTPRMLPGRRGRHRRWRSDPTDGQLAAGVELDRAAVGSAATAARRLRPELHAGDAGDQRRLQPRWADAGRRGRERRPGCGTSASPTAPPRSPTRSCCADHSDSVNAVAYSPTASTSRARATTGRHASGCRWTRWSSSAVAPSATTSGGTSGTLPAPGRGLPPDVRAVAGAE